MKVLLLRDQEGVAQLVDEKEALLVKADEEVDALAVVLDIEHGSIERRMLAEHEAVAPGPSGAHEVTLEEWPDTVVLSVSPQPSGETDWFQKALTLERSAKSLGRNHGPLRCDAQMLRTLVRKAARGIDSRSSLPVCSTVRLKAQGGLLSCVTTDLRKFTKVEAPVQHHRDLETCAHPGPLLAWLEHLEGDLEFYTDLNGQDRLTLVGNRGDSEATFWGLPADEFPSLPEDLVPTAEVRVEVQALRQALRLVLPSVSTDEGHKACLWGVTAALEGTELVLDACDTSTATRFRLACEPLLGEDWQYVLEGSTMRQVMATIDAKMEGHVVLSMEAQGLPAEKYGTALSNATRVLVRATLPDGTEITGRQDYGEIAPFGTRHCGTHETIIVADKRVEQALRHSSVLDRTGRHLPKWYDTPTALALDSCGLQTWQWRNDLVEIPGRRERRWETQMHRDHCVEREALDIREGVTMEHIALNGMLLADMIKTCRNAFGQDPLLHRGVEPWVRLTCGPLSWTLGSCVSFKFYEEETDGNQEAATAEAAVV